MDFDVDKAVLSMMRNTVESGACRVWRKNVKNPAIRAVLLGGGYARIPSGWLAWWLWKDQSITPGVSVYRLCENGTCITPDHLTLERSEDYRYSRALDKIRSLSPEDVTLIRLTHRVGGSQAELARRLGVSEMTVSNCARGKVYRDIGIPAMPPLKPGRNRGGKGRRALTVEQVRRARGVVSRPGAHPPPGSDSYNGLAREFGVSHSTLAKAAKRITYRDVR